MADLLFTLKLHTQYQAAMSRRQFLPRPHPLLPESKSFPVFPTSAPGHLPYSPTRFLLHLAAVHPVQNLLQPPLTCPLTLHHLRGLNNANADLVLPP